MDVCNHSPQTSIGRNYFTSKWVLEQASRALITGINPFGISIEKIRNPFRGRGRFNIRFPCLIFLKYGCYFIFIFNPD